MGYTMDGYDFDDAWRLRPRITIVGEKWVLTKTAKSESKNVRRGKYIDRLRLVYSCGHMTDKQCNSPKNSALCLDCGIERAKALHIDGKGGEP